VISTVLYTWSVMASVWARRAIAAAVVGGAVLAVVVADGARDAPAPLLAVEGGALVRVDPVTLRPVDTRRVPLVGETVVAPDAGSAPLGESGSSVGDEAPAAPIGGWARSPRGAVLAVVGRRGAAVRFVDVARMRAAGRLATGARGVVASVAWPRPDRLWVVLARPGCCAVGSTTVLAIDPIGRRVVARRRLEGGLARVGMTPDGPVLLLAPPAVIGPSVLTTVDRDGQAREVRLDGMSAGVLPTEGVPFVHRIRIPGLAVDPGRRRAYVISSRPHAVEVDLRRGTVRHHRLVTHRTAVDRLRELAARFGGRAAPTGDGADDAPAARDRAAGAGSPAARDGGGSPRVGPVRTAAWLGGGRVALAGYDEFIVWRSRGRVEGGRRPAGLAVVDTRNWTVRTVDARSDALPGPAAAAGGLGSVRTADGLPGSVATAGGLDSVRRADGRAVVDLQSRDVLERAPRPRVRLLAELRPRGW
jgi:hypothetical protein